MCFILILGKLCSKRLPTYSPAKLRTLRGRFQGYPFRTTIKGNRLEGFSDHFPVKTEAYGIDSWRKKKTNLTDHFPVYSILGEKKRLI